MAVTFEFCKDFHQSHSSGLDQLDSDLVSSVKTRAISPLGVCAHELVSGGGSATWACRSWVSPLPNGALLSTTRPGCQVRCLTRIDVLGLQGNVQPGFEAISATSTPSPHVSRQEPVAFHLDTANHGQSLGRLPGDPTLSRQPCLAVKSHLSVGMAVMTALILKAEGLVTTVSCTSTYDSLMPFESQGSSVTRPDQTSHPCFSGSLWKSSSASPAVELAACLTGPSDTNLTLNTEDKMMN